MHARLAHLRSGGRSLSPLALSALAWGLTLVLARLLPHPANVAPYGALALAMGARVAPHAQQGLSRFALLLVPALIHAASDLLLEAVGGVGFHPHMPAVYLALSLSAAWAYASHRFGRWGLCGAWVGGAATFFLLTNFSVWALEAFYPHTPSGLAAAYIAGLPFALRSVVADGAFLWLYLLAEAALKRLPSQQHRDSATNVAPRSVAA